MKSPSEIGRDLRLQCPVCTFTLSLALADDTLLGALRHHQSTTGHFEGYDIEQLIPALREASKPQPAP